MAISRRLALDQTIHSYFLHSFESSVVVERKCSNFQSLKRYWRYDCRYLEIKPYRSSHKQKHQWIKILLLQNRSTFYCTACQFLCQPSIYSAFGLTRTLIGIIQKTSKMYKWKECEPKISFNIYKRRASSVSGVEVHSSLNQGIFLTLIPWSKQGLSTVKTWKPSYRTTLTL